MTTNPPLLPDAETWARELFAQVVERMAPKGGYKANDIRAGELTREDERAIAAILAAEKAATERAALIADDLSDQWHKEWRADHKASSHLEGKSDGAVEVAAAIRGSIDAK